MADKVDDRRVRNIPTQKEITQRAEAAAEVAASNSIKNSVAKGEVDLSRPPTGKPTGNLVSGVRSFFQLFYPSWKPTARESSGTSSFLSIAFRLSLGVFILFLILVFIHFTIHPIFSFSPNDNGFIPIPTASDKQTAFTNFPTAPDLSANFINTLPCEYTIGMDVFNTGDFPLTTIPRVILYRNMDDPTRVGPYKIDSTHTKANFIADFPNSNLIIWVDPIKNDLYVTVITQSVDKDGNVVGSASAQEFGPVQNIAQRKTFHLTVVFSSSFIEVYINGKLEVSGALMTSPLIVRPTSYFYGPLYQIGNNIMTGNISFWPRHLSAREIQVYENAPVAPSTFFTKPAKK